jgi:hypothetical protein
LGDGKYCVRLVDKPGTILLRPNDLTSDDSDYILGQWHPWEPVLASLREALDDLGLLEEAEKLDLRSPVQDYFNPVFSTGWPLKELETTND